MELSLLLGYLGKTPFFYSIVNLKNWEYAVYFEVIKPIGC